jgi:hypothetical protein
VPSHSRMRAFDRDLIRGGHYGQRPCEPHLKHMAAPTNAAHVKKVLVNSEPSTHGTNAKASDVRFVAALKVLAYAALTFAESTPLTPLRSTTWCPSWPKRNATDQMSLLAHRVNSGLAARQSLDSWRGICSKSRLSMMRIMARRMNAATVVA